MSQEQSKDMSQYFYRASTADFMKIPGSPVAYWVSDHTRNIFSLGEPLSNVAKPRVGMRTGNNECYLRQWHEVSLRDFNWRSTSASSASKSGKKWFPFVKGGDFRKWFGNVEQVVNWENDGFEIKKETLKKYPQLSWDNLGWKISNEAYYFRPAITWTAVSSSCFGVRFVDEGNIFGTGGSCIFPDKSRFELLGALLCSNLGQYFINIVNPTLNINIEDVAGIPIIEGLPESAARIARDCRASSRRDWNSFETSWNFTFLPIVNVDQYHPVLIEMYQQLRNNWRDMQSEMQRLEEENNRIFVEAYGLRNEVNFSIPLEEITLTCNPHYRYGGNRSEEQLETLLQCDTLKELVSYAIGCMMGRYSLDKPGLILASQGETLLDYLRQIPSARFAPDDDGILPLTDQEWFADDATNRFREFVRIVWGDEHLKQNLDFVAESLCLHAIKPPSTRSGGESALDTIRRYLSTQFFKDHLRTYKKRPIYWLFSSGKHKAFECLVYLHRYHEGTLARMRTEYVIPLSTKLNSYAEKLEQDKDASASAAEIKRISNELATLHKQQAELAQFDEKLRHFADQRISLDLDDGVKVNYGKFGDLLAEVKVVCGKED